MKAECSECGGSICYKLISQEFEREGVCVSISGIRALVCIKCGEIYFGSGATQALVTSVNSLFDLAQSNNQYKGKLLAKVS